MDRMRHGRGGGREEYQHHACFGFNVIGTVSGPLVETTPSPAPNKTDVFSQLGGGGEEKGPTLMASLVSEW